MEKHHGVVEVWDYLLTLDSCKSKHDDVRKLKAVALQKAAALEKVVEKSPIAIKVGEVQRPEDSDNNQQIYSDEKQQEETPKITNVELKHVCVTKYEPDPCNLPDLRRYKLAMNSELNIAFPPQSWDEIILSAAIKRGLAPNVVIIKSIRHKMEPEYEVKFDNGAEFWVRESQLKECCTTEIDHYIETWSPMDFSFETWTEDMLLGFLKKQRCCKTIPVKYPKMVICNTGPAKNFSLGPPGPPEAYLCEFYDPDETKPLISLRLGKKMTSLPRVVSTPAHVKATVSISKLNKGKMKLRLDVMKRTFTRPKEIIVNSHLKPTKRSKSVRVPFNLMISSPIEAYRDEALRFEDKQKGVEYNGWDEYDWATDSSTIHAQG